MKIQKAISVLIILFASFQICFAQEDSKAILLNELGLKGGCEYFWSSLDVLLVDLLNEPNSIGYVVIKGNKNNILQTIIHKEWIAEHIKLRKLDPKLKDLDSNRIIAVKGEDSTEFKIQIWKVPHNAEKPFKFKTDFDYSLSVKKPFVLYDINFDPGGLCPYFNPVKVFTEFLAANPELRGNVVIHEKTKKKFLQRKDNLSKEINPTLRHWLQFFQSTKNYAGGYELWFVPPNKS